LILAVFFGPIAVLLTAAQFINEYYPHTNQALIAFYLYIPTYLLLLSRIDFIGKLMLFLTTLITIIILLSSVYVLINVSTFNFILPTFNTQDIAYSFLLVFWAIVGWEVIGNYSNDVKNTKTITKAVIFSATTVSLVYILLAAAITFIELPNKSLQDFKLVWILEPIFKQYSSILLTLITIVLCIGAIILFIGGVARLISSLKLTTYTSKHLKTNAPIGALNFLALVHMSTLTFVYLDFLNVSDLVAFADGFFIANAIIGLITAYLILNNGFLKYSSIILLFLFGLILFVSNIYILLVIFTLFIYTYLKKN